MFLGSNTHSNSRGKETKFHSQERNKCLLHHKIIYDEYKCDVCKTVYNRKQLLYRHMKLHPNVQPYICSTCGRGFCEMVELKIHKATHTNAR